MIKFDYYLFFIFDYRDITFAKRQTTQTQTHTHTRTLLLREAEHNVKHDLSSSVVGNYQP